MNYFKSSLSEDREIARATRRTEADLDATIRAIGGAKVETRDTAGARVEVLLPLVGASFGAALASSSLPIGGGF